MGYKLTAERLDAILAELCKNSRVFAPKLMRGGLVRYGEVTSLSEIVLDKKSDFSPKEVVFPIVQTMLFFNENDCTQSESDDTGLVVFVRPCDINGLRRLDTMFLKNGGKEDLYYGRLRRKLKIFMLECTQGWDSCFCTYMGTNIAEDYNAAFRFTGGEVFADVKDETIRAMFGGSEQCDFTPDYIRENTKKVAVPSIDSGDLAKIHALEMWREYDEKCIGCGGCNAVCITCSCFDTTDIVYSETSRSGERRRVWGSCMQEAFTTMAGGHRVRANAGDRMRFKTLHKIHDYKSRFGENMCVGCGRCDVRCPQDISFAGVINRLSEETKELGGTK